MLFQTPSFLALLALSLAAYYGLPRWRLGVLAVADLVFYALPDPAHLGLIAAVCLVTYACALGIGRPGRLGGWLFALGLAVNAANLVFYKYALFFLRSAEGLAGLSLPSLDSFLVKLALPIGISFYTFQLIAYLVDVRKDRIPAERSLARFWVFVSLFPKLVAGPIARGGQLLPQLGRLGGKKAASFGRAGEGPSQEPGRGQAVPRSFDPDSFGRGLALFLFGMVKKVVLADTLAPYVAKLFDIGATAAAGLGPAQAWLAAYLFTFQIYLDFSAYSDMAVGVGRLFGLDLPQNFRTPYVASGPAEFWRRWHVTLSEWIRDYVYIPLGGSRLGLQRQLLNLVLAMAFSGLWHGAGWTFVVWGVYHGLLSVVEKLWWKVREAVGRGWVGSSLPRSLWRAASIAVYFHAVVLGWVFFRAPDMTTALGMVRAMLAPVGRLAGQLSVAPAAPSAAGGPSLLPFLAVPALYLLHVLEYLARRDDRLGRFWVDRVPTPVRGLVYALAIMLVMIFTQSEQSPFIYSKF